jgi:small-conductance mechanosensitive channel
MDIGASFNEAWRVFFGFLPNLLAFLVILLIGYIVAKLVSAAVRKLLEKTGVDNKLAESDANKYVEMVMAGARPSRGIARVVFWLIFAFFLFAAIGALKIPSLTVFMNQVLAYLPNVIVAIVIFVLAAILAAAVSKGSSRVMGDTSTGKIAASALPALVMVIALFMILEQLKIAEDIVRIAFAATMFALALGLALAFGLGGRDLAGRLLEDGYRKGREEREQMRRSRGLDAGDARSEPQSVGAHAGTSTTYGSMTDTATSGRDSTASYTESGDAYRHGSDPVTRQWPPDPEDSGRRH